MVVSIWSEQLETTKQENAFRLQYDKRADVEIYQFVEGWDRLEWRMLKSDSTPNDITWNSSVVFGNEFRDK